MKKGVSPLIARAQSSLQWRRGSGASLDVVINVRGHALELRQRPGGEVENRGTGDTVWSCAFVLSKYLEKLADAGQSWGDKSVLEGISICGCVCVKYHQLPQFHVFLVVIRASPLQGSLMFDHRGSFALHCFFGSFCGFH